jgi:hypothetical protein
MEVMFDVSVASREVFLLDAFRPLKPKDSSQLFADITLSHTREERDVLLGPEMKLMEDRTQLVLAGRKCSSKFEVVGKFEGKLRFDDVVDGRAVGLLCKPEAVIRSAKLSVTGKTIRLVVRARIPLDDTTKDLVLNAKSDVMVSWSPAQVDFVAEGSPPGQRPETPDPAPPPELEPDGEQLEFEGDLPPEPGPEHAPPASPKRGRGRKP